MPHALTSFIRERMDEKGFRNRDLVEKSGLSRALVSKYATDDRARLTRLPAKETVAGFAKGLGVPQSIVLGKAIEALDLGYTSGDFINSVVTASDDELLDEIRQRLEKRGEGHADGPAANTPDDPDAGGGQVVELKKPPKAPASGGRIAARKTGRAPSGTEPSDD